MADIIHSELLKDKEVLKDIDRFKWIESEKAGYDVGFEKALLDWIVNHRATWRSNRQKAPSATSHRNQSSPENVNVALAISLMLASGSPLFR